MRRAGCRKMLVGKVMVSEEIQANAIKSHRSGLAAGVNFLHDAVGGFFTLKYLFGTRPNTEIRPSSTSQKLVKGYVVEDMWTSAE